MNRPPRLPGRRLPRIRRLRTLLLFLLLGAAVNVAVAWGCCLCVNILDGHGPFRPADEACTNWWRKHAPPGFPDAPIGELESTPFGLAFTFMHERNSDETHRDLGDNGSWLRAGWPMLSLEGELWFDLDTETMTGHFAWIPTTLQVQWLPLKPMPLGFVVNACAYGVSLLLIFGGARHSFCHLRAGCRRKRGLCPACAYPVGTSNLCTECGKPVTSRSLEAAA